MEDAVATETARFGPLERLLEERRRQVDAELLRLAPSSESPAVSAAIAASLNAPAKRIRPILALLVTDVLRGEPRAVLPAACAVEMVHTASLVLDDLPCMDDASLRRGRPACHVAFGESTAILAAFGLLNRAYEILAEGEDGGPDAETRASAARALARATGLSGMIAGQAADLSMTDKPVDFPTLEFIHSRKTGALFIAAADLGARFAGARPEEHAAVRTYAKNVGLAFQVVDDLIDVTSSAGEAGKEIGKDLRKTTFVSFAGVEGSRQLALELVAAAREAVVGFGERGRPLLDLASYVAVRRR
jgi:geranylgeranyl diphosphate synthase type II